MLRGETVNPPALRAAAVGQARQSLRLAHMQLAWPPIVGCIWSLGLGEGGFFEVVDRRELDWPQDCEREEPERRQHDHCTTDTDQPPEVDPPSQPAENSHRYRDNGAQHSLLAHSSATRRPYSRYTRSSTTGSALDGIGCPS